MQRLVRVVYLSSRRLRLRDTALAAVLLTAERQLLLFPVLLCKVVQPPKRLELRDQAKQQIVLSAQMKGKERSEE